MSGFIVGTFAGAISATAIYYSFSHSILESTRISRAKLHALSESLEPSSLTGPPPGPLPAVARISHNNFTARIKQQWNDDLQSVVNHARNSTSAVVRLWHKVKTFGPSSSS